MPEDFDDYAWEVKSQKELPVRMRTSTHSTALEGLAETMSQATWEGLKRATKVGDRIIGNVLRHEAYGVIVDIGHDYDGLIQITDFKDDAVMTLGEYPPVGEEIQAVVLGFKERGRQAWLGVKPSQLATHR